MKHSMNTLRSLRFCALAGLGPVLATAALAQDGGYGYFGISGGRSRAQIDQSRITSGLAADGLAVDGFDRDESGGTYKLFGGYQFNRWFALEGGYFDLGKFGFDARTTPAGTLKGQLKARGFNLDLVGTLPISEHFSAIARIGAQYARTRDDFSGSGAVSVADRHPSKSAGGYKLGAGLQYELSRSFLVRLEAERYRIDDAVGRRGDVNTVTLGLVFPFGRSAPAPRAMAPEPAVAPYVAPAPVVAQAPPPVPVPERRRVSYSAESLYVFDTSELTPTGKAALDTFAGELRGARFEVITVEGHTDRLGTDAYNQNLAIQRADTVRRYLIDSGGFDAGKITAVGKANTQPTAATADCKGSEPTPALKACLAPDRRVEIEVRGSREGLARP